MVKPASAVDGISLARVCGYKHRYSAAARFYADAFAHNAQLADTWPHRYNAACCAVLAACDQARDEAQLDDRQRADLRKLALGWLRVDLVSQSKQAANDNAALQATARRILRHWQEDPDLAGIRDTEAIAKLPHDEQTACRKLWADVAAALAGAGK